MYLLGIIVTGFFYMFILLWSFMIWRSIWWLLFFDLMIGYHYYSTANLYIDPFESYSLMGGMALFIIDLNILLAPIAHIHTLVLKYGVEEDELYQISASLVFFYLIAIWISDYSFLFDYLEFMGIK